MANADEAPILLRASTAQRDALHAEARDSGLSLQELLELKLFGEIRPRLRRRRSPVPANQEVLGLTA